MTISNFYTNIDGGKTHSLLDWKMNPLTTANRTALAGTLGGTNAGLLVWDTDLNALYAWNGTAFVTAVSAVSGSMTFKGAISDLVTIPASTAVGDTFVMSAGGVLAWAGITFSPSAVVQIGDTVIKRDATTFDVIQGNAVASTETVSGILELATQAETNAGVNDITAITPLKLETRLVNRATPKSFLTTGITLVADVPFVITFPSVSTNKDAFMCSIKDSTGSQIFLDVDAVDTATFTITSGVAATNVTVFTTYL